MKSLLLSLAFFATFAIRAETNAARYVKPLNLSVLQTKYDALTKRDRSLIQLYLKGAQRYVLTEPDGAFPAAKTEHWRNLAERAHGAAVMSVLPSDWPVDLKAQCGRTAAAFVVEFTGQFKTKPEFGNTWQCSWWVGEMGMAAWFVWNRLTPAQQNDVAEMIIYHADRIAAKEPGAHVEKDTEAETVSWNSTILSLAVNMMPSHPHAAKWNEAVKRYVYTIFGTAGDKSDSTLGDDNRPVKDWVAGANIHDDYSLENHNRFHIEYIYASYRFMLQGAALYCAAGNPLPDAFRHHIKEVYEQVVLACTDHSKFTIYVSDNDWKRYHLWTESPAIHGFIALLESSPKAAAMEEKSLRAASGYWNSFPPGFEYDNRYVCGKAWTPRIADIVLLHLFLPSPNPANAKDVESNLIGVHQKQDVNLITQYSPAGSFRSFFTGPGPVVRYVEPRGNPWMMLPLTSNYRPSINGKQTSDNGSKTIVEKGTNWFWVMRTYPDGEAEAFVSLPDEMIVTMNLIPAAALKNARMVDSFVSVEKPHTTFKIYSENNIATLKYGQTNWSRSDHEAGRDLKTSWLNLDDNIGFVTKNLSSEPVEMNLPPAGARGQASLFHATNPAHDVQFFTAIFPNQAHGKTKTSADKIRGHCQDGVMICDVGNYRLWVNFSSNSVAFHKILPTK